VKKVEKKQKKAKAKVAAGK